MPINTRGRAVRSVAFYRAQARAMGARSWRGALKRFAEREGKAIAHLGNDGALFAIRQDCGRIALTELQPDSVRWHNGL